MPSSNDLGAMLGVAPMIHLEVGVACTIIV